jgi:hypothetical protein
MDMDIIDISPPTSPAPLITPPNRNLWAFMRGTPLRIFIDSFKHRFGYNWKNEIENIFLRHVDMDEFVRIKIEDIRIDNNFIIVLNAKLGGGERYIFPIDSLHVTIHDTPGGPTQSHIKINNFGYVINLQFQRIGERIVCNIEDESELISFTKNYIIYIPDVPIRHYEPLEYLFGTIIPNGITNIINSTIEMFGADQTLIRPENMHLGRSISYIQKYLKYKQKYLELKKKLNK